MNEGFIDQLIKEGALFVINHSGGKDSQAMTIKLAARIPHTQLVIVHAHLPEVEWDGTVDHIRENSFGIEVRVCQAVKTFFEMVIHRGKFPDKYRRQCTSDLKRGPIEKEIRAILKERDLNVVVSCEGIRAQESSGRARLNPFRLYETQSIAGRIWHKWLPIFDLDTREVFEVIRAAGQRPFWTYAHGMSRKSCAFCIMSSASDLKIASALRPDLYEKYVNLERALGHSLQMSGRMLPELLGDSKRNVKVLSKGG